MDTETLLQAAEEALKEKGILVKRDETQPFLRCSFELRNTKIKKCLCLITAAGGGLLSYAMPPLRADEASRPAISELIHRLNGMLLTGGFDINMDTGEIRFRSCLRLPEERELLYGDETLRRELLLPVRMMDRYGDAFLEVLFHTATPEEAAQKAREKAAGR